MRERGAKRLGNSVLVEASVDSLALEPGEGNADARSDLIAAEDEPDPSACGPVFWPGVYGGISGSPRQALRRS